MNTTRDWISKNQSGAILIAIAVLMLGGIIIGKVNHRPTDDPLIRAQLKVEKDAADLVGAALDVYYVNNDRYPVEINDVLKGDSKVREAFNDLPSGEYKVSGDGKSYRIIYRDKLGNLKIKKGNYEKDYH